MATLAYVTPLLKASWDIDILVHEADLVRASEVLAMLGYRPVLPGRTTDIEEWHSVSKESVWVQPDGPPLELHSRLANYSFTPPSVSSDFGVDLVDVGFGLTLPSLPVPDLLVYLAVHGASSAWFRLKWLSDFAALVSDLGNDQVAATHEHARESGAGEAFALALLLSNTVFGTPAWVAEETSLARRLGLRWLMALSKSQLGEQREPLDRPLGTLGIHLTELILRSTRL